MTGEYRLDSSFTPFTSQQEEINKTLVRAKKDMLKVAKEGK